LSAATTESSASRPAAGAISGEAAGLLRGEGVPVALERVGILGLAAEPEVAGEALGGLPHDHPAHRVGERIDQRDAQAEQESGARPGEGGESRGEGLRTRDPGKPGSRPIREDEWRPRHRLDAADEEEPPVPGAHAQERLRQRLHPRGAVAVDGERGHALGHAGAQRGDAREILRVEGLPGAAQEHLVEGRRIALAARQGLDEGEAGEVRRRSPPKAGRRAQERRPGAADDHEPLRRHAAVAFRSVRKE